MPFPNVIVIGAQKCGTSILRDYLNLHPDIALVNQEMHFFSEDRLWRRGIDWYSAQFADAPVCGEKSPSYASWPFAPFVPERIARVVPDARFIYLVRDPIERLVSAWVHRTRHGSEFRTFDEAFARLETSEYVAQSQYMTQLDRFLTHFPAERFLVIDQADLRHDRSETLRRAFRHVGVAETFTSTGFAAESQAGTEGRWLSPTGLRIVSRIEHAIGKQRTKKIAAVVARVPGVAGALQQQPVERPTVSPELRERLAEVLAPEATRLREFTGLALSHWSV